MLLEFQLKVREFHNVLRHITGVVGHYCKNYETNKMHTKYQNSLVISQHSTYILYKKQGRRPRERLKMWWRESIDEGRGRKYLAVEIQETETSGSDL